MTFIVRPLPAFLLGAVLSFATFSAGAVPLTPGVFNSLVNQYPDIASHNIDVAYNASTDALVASGMASTLDVGSGQMNITGGTFALSATINAAGNLLSGGTLSIAGAVSSLTGTLLTGSLTDFAWSGNFFYFLFDVTGGSAAGLYGSRGGVVLNIATSISGFNADFVNFDTMLGLPGVGMADTKSVPDSGSSFALMGAALLLLGLARGSRPAAA